MNYEEAKRLTAGLTPISNVKLSLRAAELVYPIYKKHDENDIAVIGATNATRAYIENPGKETQDAAHEAANLAYAVHEIDAAANAVSAAHAALAAYAAAYAAYATDFAIWSAKDAASAVCSACEADGTIEAKIREYAAKLLAEQKGDRTC